ncbi:auxilin-related protein 2 isoform X2 [Macadamia integrifolia]|uniref:auxilin-related protein 2 isoform X2 n=1 Tax=Macadamia integrifolia TaxID=60698 RepID=UPI001C4EFF09|nr:auxilin-related protein 2 isoform X2 [Macadamia integrifolia]
MDDEFPGLLARDFGYRPQGKSAPMSASKGTGGLNSGGNLNFGIGSGGDSRSSSFPSNRSKSGWISNSTGGSILDDHDGLFGSTANQKTQHHGGLGSFDDVFGGPPKYDSRAEARGGASSASSFDYDSIFQGSKDSGSKFSSLPVFDKPKYDDDDDIFHGLPGLKSSSSAAKKDDVFVSISSPSKQSAPFDDLLGNFGRKEPVSKSSSGRRSEVGKDFDDLIPGFGGSSPSKYRATSEAKQPRQSTATSTKSTSRMMDDLFEVLEPTSSSPYPPSGLFADPLEQMSMPSNSGSARFNGSAGSGTILDDMDPLDSLGKSVPLFSTEVNKKGREKSSLRAGSMDASAGKESNEKPFARASENASQKKVPVDNYRESHQTLFDIPSVSSDFNKPAGHVSSRPSFVNANSDATNSQADTSLTSEENLEAADDVWLTVSEIPLFTQPTSAPPPSRPPPSRPAQFSKRDKGYFGSVNTKKKVSELPTFPRSSQSFQGPKTVPDSAKSSGVSSIDEFEDFAMDKSRSNVDERADILSGEEDIETNSAAAAMKEAMDRAEAKFKHAREVRERENVRSARTREPVQQDAQERELREKQERLDREREQEREEKEREQRRLERERERAREIEREKARQAVERATKEARERAAAEARLKAERAAVEKAQSEARERAERAAVQRAQAEARERAAIDARERAERAAAEARERAAAEAREKEARERAAVARAEEAVRLRAERAAVERAAAEARERAAAEARERAAAAAAARENQQKNDNDLDSFFSNMGARPSSAPRPRPNTSNPFETQFQNKGGSEGVRRTSSGTSSSMKKASSTTNIVDDLSSIFGGTSSPSGEFQEIDGESEERRRARWERQQRTHERAAKALAEKNQRDLQTQQEQAERHRISETLDIEIKRWAAGKEGNLRALLSTLQYVLWPECGWQPVSLTDLITAASVKKVYRKATLCIHPDKVQQKGANLQQKYIAEKVFDLLKEAWNKFNSEELF